MWTGVVNAAGAGRCRSSPWFTHPTWPMPSVVFCGADMSVRVIVENRMDQFGPGA